MARKPVHLAPQAGALKTRCHAVVKDPKWVSNAIPHVTCVGCLQLACLDLRQRAADLQEQVEALATEHGRCRPHHAHIIYTEGSNALE